MNRLSPLIVRRVGRFAPVPAWYSGASLADAVDALPFPSLSHDLKLFVLTWLGGLVFFGTYLS